MFKNAAILFGKQSSLYILIKEQNNKIIIIVVILVLINVIYWLFIICTQPTQIRDQIKLDLAKIRPYSVRYFSEV